MNHTKAELKAILKFVRTAKVNPKSNSFMGESKILFSLDTGDNVVWINQEQLVSRLKSKINELETA